LDGTQSRFDINDLAYYALFGKDFLALTAPRDLALAALRGDRRLLAAIAARPIRLEPDNLVPRPWGGDGLAAFKKLPADAVAGSLPYGEAFEISAFDDDVEAARYPSRLRFNDGSGLELPQLLRAQGEALLGPDFVARHGACFPLLPKTLCVRELLSVQGHPAGHTEVYVIIAADPGATLRLGFRRDIEAGAMADRLRQGLARQRELLALLGDDADIAGLQRLLAPWFASRREAADASAGMAADADRLTAALGLLAGGRDMAAVLGHLQELKTIYWHVLDAMNEIEVTPGQVIYNATPERLLANVGGIASAEVHALGNPEGREILALEIRRPGPTFRAWDNVRFPPREVDIDAALAALNLQASSTAEFLRERLPVPGRPGASVSVDCEYFRVEHLQPDRSQTVDVPAAGPHSLHCVAGRVAVLAPDGVELATLRQGESALVPVAVGA
jgi:mannose-6-phosphate isomerase class I